MAPAPASTSAEMPLEIIRVSMWRRYPFRCMAYLLLVVASSIGAIVALSQEMNVLAGIAAAVLLLTLYRVVPWWLRMRNTLLAITTHRVILETGVFHREATEFERSDVVDVRISQSWLMRLFNVGDLVITIDSRARKQFVLMAVPDPTTVAEHVRDENLNRHHQPVAGAQQAAQPEPQHV